MRIPEAARRSCERGVTLVELMVAMAVALVVVLAATAALVGGRQLSTADAEARGVEDALRFASFVVRGIVRQAGYADYALDHDEPNGAEAPGGQATVAVSSPEDHGELNIVGASNTRVGGQGGGYGSHDSRGVNGSDSLRVRFFGRSRADSTEPDGTMVDCMGFAQPGPATDRPAPEDRAWSFFYIAQAADGEPELYCKYRTDNGTFKAEPLARGIEVFKVAYGYDGNGDGVPERWLDAVQLEAQAVSPASVGDEWRKVTGLRVGMVARGARSTGAAALPDERLYPLGPEFSSTSFKPKADGRLRRVTTFTVMLRNVMRDPAS
ncbi:PilW family protein [Variovorax sp. E3]|uniref:PilW family protein n=1 Tax=Variovorax sp. E3 TaxID=1914993 RepID=UPI0018DC15E3|nr:PilW family protein [Variovorax sp. E3]